MKRDNRQAMNEVARPERLVWYRDLVEEMTGCVPQIRPTTVPVLIDGMYWQVPQVVASVPAFSLLGQAFCAVRGCGETEEEALRVLCEQVHALVWGEQREYVALASELVWLQAAGVV